MLKIRRDGDYVILQIEDAEDVVDVLANYCDPFRLTHLVLTPDKGRIQADHFTRPLSFPYLSLLAVKWCDARIVDIVDIPTLQRLNSIHVFDGSHGCLVGMDHVTECSLKKIALANLSILPAEVNWLEKLPTLISLALRNVRGFDEDFLHRFNFKNVLRWLSISSVFPELKNSMIKDLVYPAVRWLDLSSVSLRKIDIGQIVMSFPAVEAFFASNCELSTSQIEEIMSSYASLSIFHVDDERFDFNNHPDMFWET